MASQPLNDNVEAASVWVLPAALIACALMLMVPFFQQSTQPQPSPAELAAPHGVRPVTLQELDR